MVWANKKYYSIYFRYIFGARRTIEYNIYEPPNVFYAFISLVFYTLYIYKICMLSFSTKRFLRATQFTAFTLFNLYILFQKIYILLFFCVVRRAGRLLFCCIYFFLASSPLVARAWLYVCMYGDSFSRPYQPESVFEIGLRGQTGAYTAISPINWFCSECAHRAIQPYMHIYKY